MQNVTLFQSNVIKVFCATLSKIPDKFPSVIQKSLQTLIELLLCWQHELKTDLESEELPVRPPTDRKLSLPLSNQSSVVAVVTVVVSFYSLSFP